MPFEVTMPRLGWSMEKGILVKWHKQDGERVQVGDILFTVEADKANQEVEALESGLLRIPPDSPALRVRGRRGHGAGLPAAARRGRAGPGQCRSIGAPARSAAPTIAPTPIAEPAPPAVSAARPALETPAISPRARQMAQELGVEWTLLQGSGRTGASSSATSAGPAATTTRPAPRATTDRRLRPHRDHAHDPGRRHRVGPVARTAPVEVSDDDLWVHVLRALAEHPAMNARWEGDAIVQSAAVNAWPWSSTPGTAC